MTRAEKYEEVFGIKPDTEMCPTKDCWLCPCFKGCHEDTIYHDNITEEWWNGEYNENN